MMYRTLSLTGLLLLAAIGCNNGRESGQKVTPPRPDAKVTLEAMAASGSLDKKAELRAQLEGLREAKPLQAEELLGDYQELIKQSDTEAIKSKAQEMAEKL